MDKNINIDGARERKTDVADGVNLSGYVKLKTFEVITAAWEGVKIYLLLEIYYCNKVKKFYKTCHSVQIYMQNNAAWI